MPVHHKIVFTVIRNVPKVSDLYEWNVFTLHQTKKASMFIWGVIHNALPTYIKYAGKVQIPI
jgi:hypothetical protein